MSSPIAEQAARRRTFAIISHPDAGKTTLTEKLLLFGGAIQIISKSVFDKSGKYQLKVDLFDVNGAPVDIAAKGIVYRVPTSTDLSGTVETADAASLCLKSGNAAILRGGSEALHSNQAIAACVIGGVMLGGGKGNVLNVVFGAFTLQAIVNLLNQLGLPKPYTDAVQGLIIIGVVAYSAFTTLKKR